MAAFVEDRTDTRRLRELSDDQSEEECEENRYCCKLYTIENEELTEQYRCVQSTTCLACCFLITCFLFFREKLNCLERYMRCGPNFICTLILTTACIFLCRLKTCYRSRVNPRTCKVRISPYTQAVPTLHPPPVHPRVYLIRARCTPIPMPATMCVFDVQEKLND